MPKFKLIADPVDYECEYKKRNVWQIYEIKAFIIALLKHHKKFDKIGEAIPHKSAKEIVFFYHTFKKLLGFKDHLKQAR